MHNKGKEREREGRRERKRRERNRIGVCRGKEDRVLSVEGMKMRT